MKFFASVLMSLIAALRDSEATQQVESIQLAAAEIEKLAEDKQRLAEHLQEEVKLLCLHKVSNLIYSKK